MSNNMLTTKEATLISDFFGKCSITGATVLPGNGIALHFSSGGSTPSILHPFLQRFHA